MIGTLINVIAIIAGSTIGLLFNTKLPDRFIKIVFQALGLFTLFLGFYLAFKTSHLLILIGSLVIGSLLGEWMKIEEWFDGISHKLQRKIKNENKNFTTGFTTAFLLFCVGSMTILGALEEGLGGKPNLLLVKSLMDGTSSIALASAFGIGVMFSVIPLLIYQGSLTLLAALVDQHLTEIMINEITAVGGIILIGLGLKILEIKNIKTLNMIPALVVVIFLVKLSQYLPHV